MAELPVKMDKLAVIDKDGDARERYVYYIKGAMWANLNLRDTIDARGWITFFLKCARPSGKVEILPIACKSEEMFQVCIEFWNASSPVNGTQYTEA